MNTYGYVGGNPLASVDFEGLAYSSLGEHGIPLGSAVHMSPNSNGLSLPTNGNVLPGTHPQDMKCSSIASGLNKNECTKQCCIEHDKCYKKYGCNQSSWVGNMVGARDACNYCNAQAVSCVIRNANKTDCKKSKCGDSK